MPLNLVLDCSCSDVSMLLQRYDRAASDTRPKVEKSRTIAERLSPVCSNTVTPWIVLSRWRVISLDWLLDRVFFWLRHAKASANLNTDWNWRPRGCLLMRLYKACANQYCLDRASPGPACSNPCLLDGCDESSEVNDGRPYEASEVLHGPFLW